MTTVRGSGVQRPSHTVPACPHHPTHAIPTAVEWVLAQLGAMSTELDDDPREALDRPSLRRGVGEGSGAGRYDSEDD